MERQETKTLLPLILSLMMRSPITFPSVWMNTSPRDNCREGSEAEKGQFLWHLFHHLAPFFLAPCQSHKIGLKAFEVSDGWSFSVATPKQACLAVNHSVVIFFLVVFCSLLYNLAWF